MLNDVRPEGLKETLMDKGRWDQNVPLMLAIGKLKGGNVRCQGFKGTLGDVIMETADVDK